MKLAPGVIAILVLPVVVYAIDPTRDTLFFRVALVVLLVVGVGLLVLSMTLRSPVRPDHQVDERGLDRRLNVAALLAATIIASFALLQAGAATPYISGLAIAWSLLWLPSITRRVSVTSSVLINRDVKTVFAFKADMRNEPQYIPEVVSVEKITDGDVGAGTQFRSTVRLQGAATFEGIEEIVDMEWNRRIVSRVANGTRPNIGVTTFEAVGPSTRLSYRFQAVLSYPSALLGLVLLRWTTNRRDAPAAHGLMGAPEAAAGKPARRITFNTGVARIALPSLSGGPAEMAHSGIREISNEALRTPGAIRLDVGQPNFPSPDHVKEAGKRAIDENKTFYTHTQGMLSLREKLVAKVARVNGIKTTPERIACTPGGVGAIAAMLAAVVEPGDEVLLPDPGWPNYRMMPPWLGAHSVFYPCPPSAGFQPDLDALKSLVGARTKVLVVNSPNNPTGAVYPTSTLEAMVDLAQRHNLWLLSDECYDQIILDGAWTSPASLAPEDPRIATVFTFSKTYAMTGWRLGYLVGSAELVDTATKVLESNSSCVSTISQVAAEAALDGQQDCVVEMVDAYRRRRDLVAGILEDAELFISKPTGAFYIMADISPRGLPARDFAFALLRERGVSVAPGTAFGGVAPDAVRISLASSEPDLREGVGRLAEFVHRGA